MSIHFTTYKKSIIGITLPKKFTFPFYYEPHQLTIIASKELQEYLIKQTEIKHTFGLQNCTHEIGKMFGVLVVQNSKKELGYLSAFSGNISNQSALTRFVPPIYDIQSKDSFFHKDNSELLLLSVELEKLKNNSNYRQVKEEVICNRNAVKKVIALEKKKLQIRKKNRRIAKKLNAPITEEFKKQQNQESINDSFYLKELIVYLEDKFAGPESKLQEFEKNFFFLKQLRNDKSNALQQRISNQYHLLNSKGQRKTIPQIFENINTQAPGGTGDCAAPKLLQYAFLNNLKPIAMAEFWWGKPGNSAIRKHKNYYPSCRGKCEPILSHMLHGTLLEKNRLLENLAEYKEIKILFEDEHMLVINKPSELLSVPGKTITDSVYNRLKEKYPDSAKYLIIHRLDMSTSGIMLIAKTKEAHYILQSQFIKREIEKQYIAVLDGIISKNEGEIQLPLRVDLDDRPKQLVCYEYGKKALTKWKVLERKQDKTHIQFTPITGRTHQLRVHAAHILGLGSPIVGDDLYGVKANRLHLHASSIRFMHPTTKKMMHFKLLPDF